MFRWFHYLDKGVLLQIQLRFQENVLLCIYVFELVVRLKRLGRDFFSCESPDLEPWLFLSFKGLHVGLPYAPGRDIWGLHDQRVRQVELHPEESSRVALFLNPTRTTLLETGDFYSLVSHVALLIFGHMSPQSFTIGNGGKWSSIHLWWIFEVWNLLDLVIVVSSAGDSWLMPLANVCKKSLQGHQAWLLKPTCGGYFWRSDHIAELRKRSWSKPMFGGVRVLVGGGEKGYATVLCSTWDESFSSNDPGFGRGNPMNATDAGSGMFPFKYTNLIFFGYLPPATNLLVCEASEHVSHPKSFRSFKTTGGWSQEWKSCQWCQRRAADDAHALIAFAEDGLRVFVIVMVGCFRCDEGGLGWWSGLWLLVVQSFTGGIRSLNSWLLYEAFSQPNFGAGD